VIMACRSQERSDKARNEIVSDTRNENVVVKILDLASLESIKRFADDFCQSEGFALNIAQHSYYAVAIVVYCVSSVNLQL